MQMAIDAPKGTYEAPKIASAVEFSYTEEARKARFLGGTTLVVGIDANGTPQNPHLIGRPLGMGLDQSLIDTVLQWRFVPATKAGKPTVGQCMLAIRFVP
jgi:outer membrane biosynthesis protein TonB